MEPPTKKSIWNTPIREVIGRFRPEGDIDPPDLGFLIKPILAGIGIFLIIYFGYLLFKKLTETIIVTVPANTGNVTAVTAISNPFVTVFSTLNSSTIVLLLIAPIWIFILWRPIRRFFRYL